MCMVWGQCSEYEMEYNAHINDATQNAPNKNTADELNIYYVQQFSYYTQSINEYTIHTL